MAFSRKSPLQRNQIRQSPEEAGLKIKPELAKQLCDGNRGCDAARVIFLAGTTGSVGSQILHRHKSVQLMEG